MVDMTEEGKAGMTVEGMVNTEVVTGVDRN
jgi:hypothetical protein